MSPTLQKGFLSCNFEQKRLLLKYYETYVNPSLTPVTALNIAIAAWEVAAIDPVLADYLRLIDYFYSGVSDDMDLDPNKRAQLGEYLHQEVGLDLKEPDGLWMKSQ